MEIKIADALAQAEVLFRANRIDEAQRVYGFILNRAPDNDAALFGFGNCYMQRGEHGVAVNFYRRSVDANPNNLSALMNLGPSLRRCNKSQAAIEVHQIVDEYLTGSYMEPEQKKPVRADNFANWAGCYINEGNPEKALELSKKCLERSPDHTHGNNHAALALLEMGEWAKAWPRWEVRLKRQGFHERQFSAPYWDGEETEILAIHGEQGIGDEVMFASCIEDAKKKAKQVVIECERRLVPVFQGSFGVPCYGSPDELMAEWSGKITAKIAFGSLMAKFRKSPKDCPGLPYLAANDAYATQYTKRLAKLPGKKIGIAWLGGTSMTHDVVRQVPLSNWGPILETDNSFISLQYGDVAEDADAYGVHHWKQAIDDLERQIALIESLDLIITTCQSVAHFAGALGKPTYVLVPNKPRWCYGLKGSEMPLYGSVKLFRQGDDWANAIKEIAALC